MADPKDLARLATVPTDYASITRPRTLPEGYQLDPFLPLPGERQEAFADYEVYRDLGVTRTLRETGRVVGKALPPIQHRSKKERWAERVAIYDAFLADEQRAAIGKAFEKRADDLAMRRMALMEQEWDWHTRLLEKGEAMMKHPLTRVETSKDGKQITIIPTKWSLYTLVQVLDLASQLGRRSVELPTTYTQVDQHFTDHSTGGIDLSSLSPEQRAEIERIQAEAAAQALAVLTGDAPDRVNAEIVIPADQMTAPPDWYPGPGKLIPPPSATPEED